MDLRTHRNIAIGALSLAGLVAAWLLLSPPQLQTESIPRVCAVPEPAPGIVLEGAAVARKPRIDVAAATANERRHVLLSRSDQGQPIPLARIAIVRGRPVPGLVHYESSHIVVHAVTDQSGRVEVAVPIGEDLGFIASHPRYKAKSGAIVPGSEPQVVFLSDGSPLVVSVRNARDEPVEGVALLLRSPFTTSVDASSERAFAAEHVARVVTTSVSGLAEFSREPDRVYLLDALASGLALLPEGPVSRSWSGPSRVIRPHEGRVDLRVGPIGAVHFRVVDGQTGAPISDVVTPTIIPDRAGGPQLQTWGGLQSWQGTSQYVSDQVLDDGYAMFVRTRDGSPLPRTVELLVQVQGYTPVAARVAVMTPESVFGNHSIDTIQLTRVQELQNLRDSRVIVSVPSQLWDSVPRPYGHVTLLLVEEAGRGPHALRLFRGSREGDNWKFTGIPEGRYEAILRDALGPSRAIAVEVVAGRDSKLTAEFGDPQGVVLTVKNTRGLMLPAIVIVGQKTADAELSEEEKKSPLRDHMRVGSRQTWAVRRLTRDAGTWAWFVPVAPGKWLLDVGSFGHAPSKIELEVTKGRVERIDVTLPESE